jgi:uncharacterized protein (DUF58 family)
MKGPAASAPVAGRRLTLLGWLVAGESGLLLSSRLWPADRLPTPLPVVLGAGLAACLVLAWFLAARRTRGVDAQWRVAGQVPIGEEVAVGAVLSAPHGSPPLTILATDPGSGRVFDAVRLKALGPATVRPTWTARFPRRGLVRLPPLALACDQPFGLVRAQAPAGDGVEVVVLPPLGAVRKTFAARLQAWHTASAEAPEAGLDELDHLRGYRPGDPPRQVHWRASARAGRLLVAMRQDLVSRRVALLVDVRLAAGKRFERLICAAATVVDALCRDGWIVSLHGSFARSPDGVLGERDDLLALLAVAEPGDEPLGAFLPPGLAALVISPAPVELAVFPVPLVLDLDECERLMQLPRRLR